MFVVVASVVLHAIALTVVDPQALFGSATFASSADDDTAASIEPLAFTCEGEVAMASAARSAVCLSPFVGDRDQCLTRVAIDHKLWTLECLTKDTEVRVAMVDLDKIKPLKLLDVEPIDDVVAAQLLDEEVAKKVEEAQKKISQPRARGQVVEITQPRVEVPPDKARFVSEYDSSVQKETVARGSTEKMVDRPAPKELPIAPNPTEIPDVQPDPKESDAEPAEPADKPGQPGEDKGMLAMRGTGDADTDPTVESKDIGSRTGSQAPQSIDGLAPKKGEAKKASKTELEPAGGKGDGGDGGGGPLVPNLRPTKDMLARAVGGGSVDKLDNVNSGENTALNARKWKYASFFNRLKRRVAQHWHPDRVYLRRDPTGKVYGTKDRVTVLKVSLTPSGKVANIVVQKKSDVDFLDDEAVRAFREAGPFPNPPKALVDGSNLISFSFGFHFQIGGRSDRWRIFRYR